MTVLEERYRLFVEGKDDLATIVHLLTRHGLPYEQPKESIPELYPLLKCLGNDKLVLDRMAVEPLSESHLAVGFVLDADGRPEPRWESVRNQLKKAGVDSSKPVQVHGFIGESKVTGRRVGVWLMPDNRSAGSLENLLRDLIPADDPLIGHAEKSTAAAKKNHNANFKAKDRLKAELHAWLAWQERPGTPFGSAINQNYFLHRSEAADAFVAWFKQLFDVN